MQEFIDLVASPDYSGKLFQILIVLAGTQLAAWVIHRTLKAHPRSRRSQPLARATFTAPALIWAAGFAVALYVLEVNVDSIASILVAGGLVIGLVVTPAGSNGVAGFLNVWGDVYREGEIIEVDGVVGRVSHRGMISTRLDTIDGSVYDIPNKLMFDHVVHNYCRVQYFRIKVYVHVDDPNFDLRRSEKALWSVVRDSDKWNRYDTFIDEERSAEVRYHEIAGSSHVFLVIAWIEDRLESPKREDELLRECALALDDAGISYGQTTNLSASNGLVLNTPVFDYPIYNHVQQR